MLLSDGEIKDLISNGILVDAAVENVGPVTYDLQTKAFVRSDGTKTTRCELQPGDSAFIQCVEGVNLPNDLAARIFLRNSRIREGLTLDAPLYFPGHGTVLYFRVTNVSGNAIELNATSGIAQVAFERVERPVEHPYNGSFQNEVEFRGMGSYTDVYHDEISQLENKADEVKGIEQRMYANVLAIMAVVAGIFTLVNVNVQAVGESLRSVVTMNLATVGSFGALVALLGAVLGNAWGAVKTKVPAIVAVVCLVAAVVCSLLPC